MSRVMDLKVDRQDLPDIIQCFLLSFSLGHAAGKSRDENGESPRLLRDQLNLDLHINELHLHYYQASGISTNL